MLFYQFSLYFIKNLMENIYNQLLSRQAVLNHKKISQESKQQVNYGDWVLFQKNQQYSLASHSFTTSRMHCVAFEKHNMIKNCYFQIRLLKISINQDYEHYQDITHTQTIFNRSVHTQNKIALLHIETNMYLCALTQGNNQISHIILKPQLTNECIFFFGKQKNPEEDHSFANLSMVNLVHNMSKMYIKLTPSENINDNFSASLSKNKDCFALRLVRKIDPSLQIYLNNEDLVMLKNNNQATILILKQKEEILYSSYNLTNQIILNSQYFSLNNNYLYDAPVKDSTENILNLLWEIKKTTYKISDNDTNYLIKKKENVVIKHVKTGLYLCKDMKGGLSVTNDRNNPEASFKLTNSKTYQFQRKPISSAPIYLDDTIQIDGNGKQFIFVKRNNKSFVKIVNQNLIKFFEYLLEYLDGDDSNQEEIKTLQKKYRYVYDMFSKNFQNTTDQGEYLFQISLVFLQILNAKVDTKMVRFLLPKARLLKQFLESLIKFLQIFTSKEEPYSRYSNSTKKHLISLAVGLFGKIDYLNLQPLVANIAQAQCGLCISQLTSKTKIFNSNLSSRSDLMLRLKTIRVINKICQKYRLKFYYIPDILKKICQNVSISIQNGVIAIAEGKFTLELLDETSFAQTQEYANSRSAYFMELMKLCYYQNTIHEDILIRIIFILREMIGEYNNILFLNTLLEIFNNFYLQRSYLPFIQNITFVFIDGWLQATTELSFILTDGGFSDFLVSQTLMKLIRKIQQGIWEKLKIQDRLKYLSSIIYTIGLFIAYGELTLEIFKQLQIFLIKILLVLSNHIENHSSNQQIKFQPQLKTLSSEFKKFFSMPQEDQISSQLMQATQILIDALNTSFKVIKCQKFRLFSYPLINNRQKLFSLNFFKEVYHSLQFYAFIDTNFPIIQQIAEMYKNNHTLTRTRQNLSYFWSEDRLIYHEKLVVMKQILIQMHKIKRINQTLFKFDHQKKITEDLISDIKEGVIEISSHLLENSSKQLKSFSELCIRGLSLPQSMYQIIFNSQNLEEEFSVQLLNFLYHYPPKFHTLLQQIHHSPTTFIKITAKSLQLNQGQILLEDVIKLVELSQKKLKDQQLIYFLGVLHEFWNGNQKLNLFFYEKLISMQIVYNFLQASRTLKSLKLYWNQIEKDNNFKHICDKYCISLILIFWLSMRNPTCHRHIRNYFRWEQIFRIVEDEQVPHAVKSVFVAYLHTDTKVFKDITIFDRYLIFIKSMLSQYDTYTKNLQYYDSSNFLLKGQNAHAEKGQFLSLEEMVRFDWRKVDYWQSLYFRPFYRQEQGIIPFLEYLMTNMPTSFRAYCSQNTITGIHSQLTGIRSLLKHQTKCNDDLIVKITKILFLIQQSFPHIKVDKSQFPQFRMRHIVIDRIVNFLFNHGRLQSFVREFDTKNEEILSDSSGKSIEHISANSSSMLEQSDSSHEMTKHAFINPMPKSPQQYINKSRLYTLKLGQILSKVYNIFKQKKQNLLPQRQLQSCQFVLKCSKNKQQIILERMMVAYYQIGGAISDILSATHDRISSLRSKAVARKYLSRYSFQRKLQYSDDVRMYQISNVRTDSQACMNSFIIEKQLMKKQNLLLEEINERSQIECSKFSDLLYFIKRKKIMTLFYVLKTFKAENFCSFSIDEVDLLFNLLLTNKQDTFKLINEEVKICYIKSIKMLLKNLMNSKCPQHQKLLASIQSQRIIFEFLYKMSLDQLKPEIVQEIIDVYLLYQQSTGQYHLHIYEIIEEKILKKMKINSRQLLCSMSKILAYFIKCSQRCFDDCQSKLKMEQFMNSELIKNFLINTLNKTIYQSLDSENFIAQERIKVVLQIYDLLLLQVLELPIQTTKRLLKGQLLQLLVQMEINLYLRVYSQQFSITKKYLTQDRFDSLNNIIIQSLNIFHNIKFMSNPAVQGLSILKQQRINLLCLEDQKSEKFKSKLQLLNWSQAYHFYENRFHFIIIVKNNKQVVSVFPKQQNVSGKWKLLLLGQMNKEKSLTAKKQFVFKITQYVMNKQEQNREQMLASFLQQSKRTVLTISVMIISLLTLLCFLYDGMNEWPVTSVKIVLLSLNLPFVLFLILQKIVYFITVSKMTFQTNQSSLQQSHTTEDKLTFFLKISKNFIGIIMGLALLGLNIGSYLRSEIIPALYLVIPFYSWGNTDFFMQLFLKRGSAILQISVIFFFLLLLFQLIGRVSSYQSMSQANLHPFYNNQRGELYYNNYLSLLFAEWKQKYNKYLQTIIFSFVESFYYFFIIGFMVFHSIDHESKSSQQHSVCYLCPDRVSVVKVDFLKHVQYEHNAFKYAFFFKYILKKKEKELTSTEKSIKELIVARNHHLFLR